MAQIGPGRLGMFRGAGYALRVEIGITGFYIRISYPETLS